MELISKRKNKNSLIFGKYKLTKIIGRGSFGFVYEGRNVIDGKRVNKSGKKREWIKFIRK